MWTRRIWYILQAFLSGNILLNRFFAHIARRARKVGASPQRRQFAGQFSKLFAQGEGREAFELLDHCGWAIGRPNAHKEVNVVRHDRKPQDRPSLLFALCFDKRLTPVLDCTNQQRLTPFGTPDEMVHDEVYPMLIPLIVQPAWLCCFHSGNIQPIQRAVKG
jgi:hypothetical protein